MIAYAKQNGNSVSVYNIKGQIMFKKYGSLVGYTNETVSVKTTSNIIWTYNSAGIQKICQDSDFR